MIGGFVAVLVFSALFFFIGAAVQARHGKPFTKIKRK